MVTFEIKPLINVFIKYDIAINRIDSRIGIDQVVVDGSKLQLMKDVFWDFIEEPHLLIGGGHRRREDDSSHVDHLCSC